MHNATTLKGLWNRQQSKLKIIAAGILLTGLQATTAIAQQGPPQHHVSQDENYGNTLNLGVGFAYFGDINASVPYFSADYEINVARSFTLAPFIGIASFRSDPYYYGNQYYYYHETIVPVGVKGTYYFDRILNAGPRWDFYLAASLGFVIDHQEWDNGYNGDHGVAHSASPLYLDGHIGAEYHLNHNLGLFLDLSTGVSTFGLAIHNL